MLRNKGGEYLFVDYSPVHKDFIKLLKDTFPGDAQNFFIDKQGILVATEGGTVYYDNFFPRRSKTVIDTNVGGFLDAWWDKDDNLYVSVMEGHTKSEVWEIPNGAQTLKTLSPLQVHSAVIKMA